MSSRAFRRVGRVAAGLEREIRATSGGAIRVDTRAATQALERLAERLRRLRAVRARVSVYADVSAAVRPLLFAWGLIRRLNGTRATATVRVDVEGVAALLALIADLRRLDGANRRGRADVDTSSGVRALGILGQAFAAGERAMASFNQASTFVRNVGGTVARSGLAAFVSLINPLTAGLLIGTSALGGFSFGLGAVGAAAISTVTALSNYESQQEAITAANEAASTAAKDVARAETDLARQEAEVVSARGELEDATEDLERSQRSLNTAMYDEPLRQKEGALDLAQARLNSEKTTDRLSATQREYNAAVASGDLGRARELELELRQLRIDEQRNGVALEQSRRDLYRLRASGSSDLQGAMDSVEGSSERQRDAQRSLGEALAGVGVAEARVEEASAKLAAAQARAAEESSKAGGPSRPRSGCSSIPPGTFTRPSSGPTPARPRPSTPSSHAAYMLRPSCSRPSRRPRWRRSGCSTLPRRPWGRRGRCPPRSACGASFSRPSPPSSATGRSRWACSGRRWRTSS